MTERIRTLPDAELAVMQAVWDWEHERMLDRTAHVKTLLSMM